MQRRLYPLMLLIPLFYLFGFESDLSLKSQPTAPQVPFRYSLANRSFTDNYIYLRNLSDSRVTDYISRENKYADSFYYDKRKLGRSILSELKRGERMDESLGCASFDPNAQILGSIGNYLYSIQYSDNLKYPKYYRSLVPDGCACPSTGENELVLDVNRLLPNQNEKYFHPGIFEVDPSGRFLAFSFDLVGDEKYQIVFFDLENGGKRLDINVKDSYYSARWKTHGSGLFLYYNVVGRDGIPSEAHRICVFGCSGPLESEVLYVESDPSYTVEVGDTADGQYILIKIIGQITSETRLIDSNGKLLDPIFNREVGVMYDVEVRDSSLFLRTNGGGRKNYFLLEMPFDRSLIGQLKFPGIGSFLAENAYKIIVPHRDHVFIEKMEMYRDFIAVWYRKKGKRSFVIYSFPKLKKLYEYEQAGVDVYSVKPLGSPDMVINKYTIRRSFTSSCFWYTNSSFVQGESIYSIDTKKRSENLIYYVIHEKSGCFVEKRIWTKSEPSVPISLVYQKTSCLSTSFQDLKGPRPVFLQAYGAYGGYFDISYQPEQFVLLNRGFVIAVCHPRGDGDLGADWYDKKINTFVDVELCMKELVDRGYTAPGKIVFFGRSAGGLVAGNVVNSKHHYVRAVVAQVPFIDPIYDMMDPSVPWTAFEWFEWGDSRNPEILEAMVNYSPYHNTPSNRVPSLFVTTGLSDPRVPFWEPIKWVAKLRETKPQNKVLLRIRDYGHYGSTAGDAKYLETVEMYVFVISELQ